MKTRRDSIEDTNEAEASDAEKKIGKSDELSIFSTILTDIKENPKILQNRKMLISEFSIFSTILADIDEEDPMILLQKKNNKKIRRRGSMKTSIDFASTVSQTLTSSHLVELLNQELKILESEMEMIKGQTSDRLLSECDCVQEKKVEQREEVRFLADEVIEWLLKDEIESDISRFPNEVEDTVCKVEDGNSSETLDEMLSTMLEDEDEQVLNNTEGCVPIDGFIEEMLVEVEKDGSYLYRMKDGYAFGGFLENLIRDRLREKAEEEEKEISSWISNGEPEVVVEEEKEVKKEMKKEKAPMVVKMERRTVQESTVSKRDCNGYRRRLYLIEKMRERHENLMKKRVKAARLGVELSFLVAEFMFLIPNEILASGNDDDYRMYTTNLFGVNGDDKGTSVVIRKLQEVTEIVIWKKDNKEYNADLPESVFRYGDFFSLCSDAIRVLGKIVWDLKRNQCERPKLSDLDSLFEDCQNMLMKIELKLAEMKQWVYRSVSTDYESFSKSERFDSLLRRKLMKRINADNRFQRSLIGSYFVEIWKSVFQTEALQEQWKQMECFDA